MSRKQNKNKGATADNRLRIVGGQWRGRKLSFPHAGNIRPTPDRVRETLFNWLQHQLPGARCLDLFAGSGALGLEALSRGARKVDFVERQRVSAAKIGEHLRDLGGNGQVHCRDAFDFLQANADTFDIVFADPPFADRLLNTTLTALVDSKAIAEGGRVYVESAPGGLRSSLPAGWDLLRQSKAGQVEYGLVVHNDRESGDQSGE